MDCIATSSQFGIPVPDQLELFAKTGWDGFFCMWKDGGTDLRAVARKARDCGLFFQSVHAPFAKAADFWHEDGVAEIAKRLRNAAVSAMPEKIDYAPVFKHTVMNVTLPRRRASYLDFKNAQAELERLTAIMPKKEAFEAFCAKTHANEKIDGPGPYDSKLHHFVLIKNAEAVIKRYQVQNQEPTISFDMNVVRLGDIAVASNPFELYLYYGQNIKARSKAQQTFLVQLAAGADLPAGYLPSPDGEKFGGYGGLIINGQVGSEGGYKLADITVTEINKLFGGK